MFTFSIIKQSPAEVSAHQLSMQDLSVYLKHYTVCAVHISSACRLHHKARSRGGLLPVRFASRGLQSYRSQSPTTPETLRPAHSKRGSEASQRRGFTSSVTATSPDLQVSTGLAGLLTKKFDQQRVCSPGASLTRRFAPHEVRSPRGSLSC